MGASPGFASISGWFVELDEKEPSALSETLITMALQVPQQSGCAELSRMSGRRGLSYVLARLEPNGPTRPSRSASSAVDLGCVYGLSRLLGSTAGEFCGRV